MQDFILELIFLQSIITLIVIIRKEILGVNSLKRASLTLFYLNKEKYSNKEVYAIWNKIESDLEQVKKTFCEKTIFN